MADDRYIVLMNECLKKYLVSLPSKKKERLREKFEFLESGIWDAGIRVKKLKGVSGKVVLEARVAKGDRILFTLGNHGARKAVYVWGMVTHDEVGSAARSIVPENAPFLGFEPDTTEDYPELLIDELPGDYYSQEDIDHKSSDDCGPQKWLVLGDDQWKRLLLAAEPDNFEIFLYLSTQQKEILHKAPPILLSGTAGSGKTTISVYFLLKREFLDKSRIYLTFSPHLKDFSERIYKGLIARTDLDGSDNQPEFHLFRDLLFELTSVLGLTYDRKKEIGLGEFERIFRNHRLFPRYDAELVWEEIRSVIKGAKPALRPERLKKLIRSYRHREFGRNGIAELKETLLGLKNLDIAAKIQRVMEKRTGYGRIDDLALEIGSGKEAMNDGLLFVLDEIVKMVEKREKEISSPLLSFAEYESLGKKRAPNFFFERKEIYDIAVYYQGKLEEAGLWDEIDLCRHAIQGIERRTDRFSYDLVVCDEAQDFSDIQLSLVFRLAKSHRGIVFAGDPKQIINPSGFRWEEVKNRFYERGVEVPEVENLRMNFRCVGNIVRLSNALLDLKHRLAGLSGSEMKEDWKFNGRPPFLLSGMDEKGVLAGLFGMGAGQIILARDRIQRDRLKAALGTELVFTIEEAKGLEFHTVFLWKFVSTKKSGEIWRRIRDGNPLDKGREPLVRHEINLLYVAITRARNTLILFEPSSDLWDLPDFSGMLYKTPENEVLSTAWQKISTPEEWESQGDYFFERGHYAAAQECFKNGGNFSRANLARAFLLEARGDFKAAAELFEKAGEALKAAECYEESGLFRKALPLWEELKRKDRSILCRIRGYEEVGDFDRAAEGWWGLKEEGRAEENWAKAGNHRRLGEYYASRKRHEAAGEEFEKAKEWETAATYYQKVKRVEKAADLYFRVGLFAKAFPLYKRLKNREKILSCLKRLGDDYSLAQVYEKEKDFEKAIRHFRLFSEASAENRASLLGEAERFLGGRFPLKGAVRSAALSLYEKSAPLFFEKKYYRLALEQFRALGDHVRAAECCERIGDFYGVALEHEQSGLSKKRSEISKLLEMHLYENGGLVKQRSARLLEEARAMLAGGAYEKALVRFEALDRPEEVYDAFLKLNRDEEAIRYFLGGGHVGLVAQYLKEREDPEVSPDFFRDEMMEEGGGNYYWLHQHPARFEVVVKLIRKMLGKDKDGQFVKVADEFLSSFYYVSFREDYPDFFLDFVLETKNANFIVEMVQSIRRDKTVSEAARAFLKKLDEEGARSQDGDLLACYLFWDDPVKFESFLGELPLTPRNYSLFSQSYLHYDKAVDYFLSTGAIERAATLCSSKGDSKRAGRIYEEAGEVIFAARAYRDGGLYEDALRCFTKAGDEVGLARTFERMGDFDRAEGIWKRLGKEKELARLRRKKGKQAPRGEQYDLFKEKV